MAVAETHYIMAALPLPDEELLARLIAFDTSSGSSNLPIADFVCEYLDRPGVRLYRVASADGRMVNVIAVAGGSGRPAPGSAGGAGGAEGADGLVLSGHFDVVPPGDGGWQSDPFTLTKSGDTWVARGSADMKGFVALAMNRLRSVQTGKLRAPLALLLTYDEELGSLGAQRLLAAWPAGVKLPHNVVVGEPTSLRAVRMHKGHLSMRVTVHGRAAHSGSPQLGVNAIEPAARIVTALTRLGETLKRRPAETARFFAAVPYPVLNVGMIHGGSAVNVIPERCVIELGVRLLPGGNAAAMAEQIRDATAKTEPSHRVEVEVVNDNPPMFLPESARIHQILCGLLGQKQSYGVTFASDAGVLAQNGYECVLFGPGSIEVAHKLNECLPIDEFHKAGPILDRLIGQMCQ